MPPLSTVNRYLPSGLTVSFVKPPENCVPWPAPPRVRVRVRLPSAARAYWSIVVALPTKSVVPSSLTVRATPAVSPLWLA